MHQTVPGFAVPDHERSQSQIAHGLELRSEANTPGDACGGGCLQSCAATVCGPAAGSVSEVEVWEPSAEA
eukprot:15386128-Alexandrium_andersonii.AAC.1